MGGAQIAIIGVLGLRMRQLQIRDAKQYRMLAEDNRINLQLIAPARGRILDRFGDVLADNRPTYQVTIVREQAGDLASTLRQLQLVLPITDDDIAEIMKSSEKTSAFVPLSVAERGGSVCLNRFRGFLKWISALVTLPPIPVSAG